MDNNKLQTKFPQKQKQTKLNQANVENDYLIDNGILRLLAITYIHYYFWKL
ncbi:hypothetical protein [Spiroplasma endosymbiont of Notiophilus biguttatus]|uniref:hypothetical protein n=1 Tax=Spiroplasma endosymbiont of Notiophilus biguttatus TaxID=3066285 RepID=UPI00313E3303